MKRILILPLLLAACAPSVQTNPVTTASRTYAATCPAALDSLTAVAIRTQPSDALGLGNWAPLSVTSRTGSSASYVSKSRNDFTVTVLATCTGTATLKLDSAGQNPRYLEALNKALLDGVTVP